MDLSGLTVFVKYGSEILFGKLPSKTIDLLGAAGKDKDNEFIASVSKQITPVPACNNLNNQV